MGFISRKIFPACGRMCICCPALRSRSRQPVKRYKKLITDIFPKTSNAQTNERKIVKLCEYASKNPVRIPKITKYLEERLQKELRSGHQKVIYIIAEVYVKLLSICSNHLAYFAASVLNVTDELLDSSKQDALHIAGCRTLTRFIYSQTDGTYARNIEGLVHKVCSLAHGTGEEHQKCSLSASILQCLSSMIWFMGRFSHVFENLDEIVQVTLENYKSDLHFENDEMGELRHHWVDEVVRCEGRSGAAVGGSSPSHLMVRCCPEKKEPSLLTREESESPNIWAQICVQRMAELAIESSTMRRLLDPMFVYFDSGAHWVPQGGLAVTVLSDLCYFVDGSENQQLILSCLVRHLDHKNVSHDPIVKANVIWVATYLALQIRLGIILVDSGCIGDLCRHLRKSLQATSGSISEDEANVNIQLQNSIETCVLEMARGMKDAGALFDCMTIALEKLPPVSVFARATIGSLIVLAHVFASAFSRAHSQMAFPEALLIQLLKAMLHPDTEVRIGAHHIFSVLLFPTSNHTKQRGRHWRSGCCHGMGKHPSNTSSTFASVNALLEKLRKEKDGISVEKHGSNNSADKQMTSPNFCWMTSIIDQATGCTTFTEAEPCVLQLTEDQIVQLLSGFWIQANLPDNRPSNYEAIAHSYNLTLISYYLKKTNNLAIRFFQLALSLRNIALDPNCGKLLPAWRRSLYSTATATLMFSAKMFQMHNLNAQISTLVPHDADPYLGISEDLHLYVKPSADLQEYGSAADNQAAMTVLCEIYSNSDESDQLILDIVVEHLALITEVSNENVRNQLLEGFSIEDAFMFTPESIRELDHIQLFGHVKECSVDGDLSANSIVEDDSVSSFANFSSFAPKRSLSPSTTSIISIGQLLESALEVAGQVAGSSVSTSPLPYSTMASQCEALGTGTRKKLASWLVQENHLTAPREADEPLARESPPPTVNGQATVSQILSDGESDQGGGILAMKDPCLSIRLPPASPFDSFLRVVSGPNARNFVQQVAI